MTDPRANPLLQPWQTPFGLPPFGDVRPGHFVPAFERAMSPRLAARHSAILLHAALFDRIDRLHRKRGDLRLSAEQMRLLERVPLDFIREGARLSEAAKRRYAAIVERLATLSTRFSQNALADEADFRLVLRTKRDLAGLPEDLRDAARSAALERGEANA